MNKKLLESIIKEQQKQTSLLQIIATNLEQTKSSKVVTNLDERIVGMKQEMLKEYGVIPDRIYLVAEAHKNGDLPIFVWRQPLKF